MSKCLEYSPSMTGSTNSGPLQPQKDTSPLPARSSPFDLYSTPESPTRRGHRQRASRKMSLTPSNGQPIQLTPLWEHVVRTRKFPTEVDTRLTFLEISERLRDPEWEVRQHALRVLIDVLPTLNADVVDKVMQPVVPELVNNLGHPAPAVRKGALDAFRVFLIHSHDRENMIKYILQDGLNRSEVRDSFQTNVTTGVILSVPSLLFPSSSSPSPKPELLKDATVALASRLAQVPHQEAVLKSLLKIRDAVGVQAFESYLEDYDDKLKRNIEVLAKIYNVRYGSKKSSSRDRNIDAKSKEPERKWESDSDTSGIAEEEDEANNVVMPPARVVLETEIKFDEETAITMTILEEKDSEEEPEGADTESETGDEGEDNRNKRKTPRRVHFGGEIVKLRTPDSDEAEVPKTRIPLPVSPATKMPNTRSRPSSQPCSPSREVGGPGRASRSVSSSPKKEVYVHNASLSPKKSILSRTGSLVTDRAAEQARNKKNSGKVKDKSDQLDSVETRTKEKSSSLVAGEAKLEEPKRKDPRVIKSNQAEDSKKFDDVNDLDQIQKSSMMLEDEVNVAVSKIGPRTELDSSETRGRQGVEVGDGLEDKTESAEKEADIQGAEEESEHQRQGSPSSSFGSVVGDNEVDQVHDSETIRKDSGKSRGGNGDRESRIVEGERTSAIERDKGGASANGRNGNASAEMEGIVEEPSWEDLGLVDREVLEDLHNKDDWRARVRGMERVVSALRTSSALIAIEPRLGSLLHAVLGCERSCRVAAAGMAVAKVVIAGVSEEALRRRLPQLAWGLARHGGPNAAQLARITMLRIRPALLLEQLLQPQCINARNAKIRENTLQLLIFSLVTFPSTEFKVDMVANKVAKMARDRRRRVRQAALDTLAVLAQIYEPEEVLAAGKRASEGYHDGEAMMSAIRARLARKSLPLVSADGLVMYGLQISPTVQIATGPDVDWIVAGSGSVSPGIGRSKGQVIATRAEKEKLARNGNANYRANPWGDRQNFVTLGVGMRSKPEQPIVWQLVPTQNQDMQCEDELNLQSTRDLNAGIRNGEGFNSDVKSRNQTKLAASTKESSNYRGIVENNSERRENNNKAESRIPVLYSRECAAKPSGHNLLMDRSSNPELISVNLTRKLRDTAMKSVDHANPQEESVRSRGTMYQQRKRSQQENSTSTHYDNYRLMKNINNANVDCNNGEANLYRKHSDGNSRVYEKFIDKDRSSRKSAAMSRYSRSSSMESRHTSLSRSSNQQTFVIQNIYNSSSQQEGRFVDENTLRQQQAYGYSHRTGENNDKSTSRARSHRKTKDVGAQKIHNVQLTSSIAQTSDYFPAIYPENHRRRRRLRSLSPSQLYHRQQFVRTAAGEIHAFSMYDIDKAVDEEEYNEKNRRHFLPEDNFGDPIEPPSEGEERDFSSSDAPENNDQQDTEQDTQDTQDESDSRSSSPEEQNADEAFDIITSQSSPHGRDTVDFIISMDQKVETGTETALDEDESKEWSSEEDAKSKNQSRTVSRASEHRVEFPEEDPHESLESHASDETERTEETLDPNVQERSIVSVSPVQMEVSKNDESLQTSGDNTDILHSDLQRSVELSPLRRTPSPKKSSRPASRNSVQFEETISSRRSSCSSPQKLNYGLEEKESVESSEETPASSTAPCDNESTQSEDQIVGSKDDEIPAIIIASRPHSSNEVTDYVENGTGITDDVAENDNNLRFVSEPNEDDHVEDEQGKDSTSETNTEPGILKIETEPLVPMATTRRKLSRVPRVAARGRSKGNSEKMKPAVQQCFSQLESKDWEIVMKGLKSLSQIAKQQPEYLDASAAPTISRLVGRQIKSLRSQVARTACSTAGDIFSTQVRGIDQDFDDIVCPLLHRTADTNRFLRADSNAALDRMVEHLPPHKTIGVIVQRGASHQNAIVRAATARLLATVVDRIGPDHTLTLPKDVRDKLLFTGARLLIDGNLDARNHAKRMFRRLVHREGFRKALTDAVPETTLRHIDKTLRTL